MNNDTTLTSVSKNLDDNASELSVESFSRKASLERGLSPQRQQKEADEDEQRASSYLPQQLQSKKGSPKLAELPEKWNQSFGSSVGSATSVHSTDSPKVYATINLPSVRSSMATAEINNTASSRSRSPVRVDVTTTHTGRSLTPPRSADRQQPRKASAITPPKVATAGRSPLRAPIAKRTPKSKSPKRSPATTPSNSAKKNSKTRHTPPPPDMNAGLYYFAQMGPEQSEPEIIETFKGSCQCGEIQLQVRLNRRKLEVETTDESLAVEDKIYYRYIRAKQTDFDITKGQAFMSTYFVTMSAPPILSSSPTNDSSSASSGGSANQKSKFFIRPNKKNTSPRSQSKGARVFCPQCGVHVLYVPGKNAPKVHLNINCFPTLVQAYPPPPPPPPKSQSLKEEAWFWDYQTYSRYVLASNKNVGPTGYAILDWCWQWIQDNLGEYYFLPLIQDLFREYLLLPSSHDRHSTELPPDTPRSVRESMHDVGRAFEGTPTPNGSFLDEDDGHETLMDMDDNGVMREDGVFREELFVAE